jgi:ribosomal protein L40E
MEWFDTIKGTVKKTAGKAYEKSSEIVEVTKINFKISEAQTKIEKDFEEIGRIVYGMYKDGENVSEDLKDVCALIDDKFFEIETLNNQIEEIKQIKICKSCKSKNNQEAKFCSNCGVKID